MLADRLWLEQVLHNLLSNAIQAQNAQVSAGQIGGKPSEQGQQLNATITARTLLKTTEEFENIILRANNDGSTVRLRGARQRGGCARAAVGRRPWAAGRSGRCGAVRRWQQRAQRSQGTGAGAAQAAQARAAARRGSPPPTAACPA